MTEKVTIFYLEMLSPDQLDITKNQDPDFRVEECQIKQFEFNKFLYSFVGKNWQWHDKLIWSDEDWRQYSERDVLKTWAATKSGSPAGYYELEMQKGANVEIKYFGLGEKFIGHGHGGYLLSHAIQSAWSWGAKRVWVHTCSLDHPGALANYEARGLTLYKKTKVLS